MFVFCISLTSTITPSKISRPVICFVNICTISQRMDFSGYGSLLVVYMLYCVVEAEFSYEELSYQRLV
jgi:hypothetical protein